MNTWPNDHRGNRASRWLAARLLRFAEFMYLLAYGWRRTNAAADGDEAWQPPAGHPKADQLYARTHAVNSTRYYLGARWTARRRRGEDA